MHTIHRDKLGSEWDRDDTDEPPEIFLWNFMLPNKF